MLFHKKAKALASLKEPMGQVLEMLPSAIVKGDSVEKTLLRYVLANANVGNLKRLGALVIGASAAVSVAGNFARSRMLRQSMARELKKQLAPMNRKLDELEKQNEELKKQNEQLRKQLQ